jgi:hypothetical protein
MWPVIDLIPLIGWNYSIQTEENMLPMKALEFITGHVVLTQLIIKSYSLKPPMVTLILKFKPTQHLGK